jgi:hypothetical protein
MMKSQRDAAPTREEWNVVTFALSRLNSNASETSAAKVRPVIFTTVTIETVLLFLDN